MQILINNNNAGGNNPDLITPIKRVMGGDEPAIKFLGVFIDPKLDYKYHVSKIIRKASSALYFMRNAKHLLDKKALLTL